VSTARLFTNMHIASNHNKVEITQWECTKDCSAYVPFITSFCEVEEARQTGYLKNLFSHKTAVTVIRKMFSS